MEETEHLLIQRVVLDAGPIIHLDEIESLHLLKNFKELLIPEAVWKEIEYHRPAALNINNIPFIKIPVLMDIDSPLAILCNTFDLDEGESQAIFFASMQQNAIFLTDDAAARLAAKSIGIRAYGTIGVLLRAIRRKQLTAQEVIKHLEEIPSISTLYIKHTLLQSIVEEVKKGYGL